MVWVSHLSCFQTVVGAGGLEHVFKEREGSGAKSQPDSAGEAVLGRAPVRPPSGTDGGTRGQLVSEGSLEGRRPEGMLLENRMLGGVALRAGELLPRQPFCFFALLFHGDGLDPCLLYSVTNLCP